MGRTPQHLESSLISLRICFYDAVSRHRVRSGSRSGLGDCAFIVQDPNADANVKQQQLVKQIKLQDKSYPKEAKMVKPMIVN